MNAMRIMEDAVNMPHVSTYLTASIAPVILGTPGMVSPVQVHFCHILHALLFGSAVLVL